MLPVSLCRLQLVPCFFPAYIRLHLGKRINAGFTVSCSSSLCTTGWTDNIQLDYPDIEV